MLTNQSATTIKRSTWLCSTLSRLTYRLALNQARTPSVKISENSLQIMNFSFRQLFYRKRRARAHYGRRNLTAITASSFTQALDPNIENLRGSRIPFSGEMQSNEFISVNYWASFEYHTQRASKSVKQQSMMPGDVVHSCVIRLYNRIIKQWPPYVFKHIALDKLYLTPSLETNSSTIYQLNNLDETLSSPDKTLHKQICLSAFYEESKCHMCYLAYFDPQETHMLQWKEAAGPPPQLYTYLPYILTQSQ